MKNEKQWWGGGGGGAVVPPPPLPLIWTIYGLPPFLQENLNPSMIFQKSQPLPL